MVATDNYQKLTRLLELYLLRQADGEVPTTGYALIALMPVDSNSWIERQTLLLSIPPSVTASQRTILRELFVTLKKGLPESEYFEIYNIDLLESNSFPVQRITAWAPQRVEGAFSAPISLIGGVSGQSITVIRSNVLVNLSFTELRKIKLSGGESFTGKLTAIRQTELDAQLSFQTENGLRSCSYLSIIQVSYR